MTPDLVYRMERSVFGTIRFGWFRIDQKRAKDYSLDAIAKRVIAASALVLLVAGSIPLVTSVHGQQPTTALEYEVQDLREKVGKFEAVRTDLALVIAHQQLEDERYKEQHDFQGKIVLGFIGEIGGIFMAIFGWFLHQMGITFEVKQKRRSTV